MKHSVKFAEREEPPEYFPSPRLAPRGRAVPPVNSIPAEAPVAEPDEAPAEAVATSDLVAELEAALMADLDSVSSILDRAPEAPEHSPSAPPVQPEEEDVLDAEALQRLMASIRQPAAKPNAEEHPPVRPRISERQDRPADGRRADASRPRTPDGRRLQSSVLVGAALVALAGGGAFMTIQSVTAHDGPPAAAMAAPMADSEPLAAPDGASQGKGDLATPVKPAVVKSEDRPPVVEAAAASDPAPDALPPVRLASANADPQPAAVPMTDTAPPAAPATAEVEPSQAPAAEAAIATPAATDVPSPAMPAAAADVPPAAPQAVASIDPQPQPARAATRSLAPVHSGPARITSGVKLRSNPDNSAPVISLLPAGASVNVVGCKGWCEVVAGDKRGFVFQRFLSQSGAG